MAKQKLKPTDASFGRMSCLFIAKAKSKGLGVFTTKKIKTGSVVEIAPVISMPGAQRAHLDKTLLHDYIFIWGKDEKEVAMALGWVPLYNHSYESNCEYQMNYKTNEMAIVAVRDIQVQEEVTINYNGTFNDPKKVWFDVK